MTIEERSFDRILKLSTAKGVKLPLRVYRYIFFGFENILTKLWRHIDKSNTQVWNLK